MKARIKLDQFPESSKGQRYYGLINNEAEYERVKNSDLDYERSKRVTHYLVPASVFERLLNLDRTAEKRCGHWKIKMGRRACRYEHGEPRWEDAPYYECSCCNTPSDERFNFCPECGADLREVEEYAEDDPNKPEEKK